MGLGPSRTGLAVLAVASAATACSAVSSDDGSTAPVLGHGAGEDPSAMSTDVSGGELPGTLLRRGVIEGIAGITVSGDVVYMSRDPLETIEVVPAKGGQPEVIEQMTGTFLSARLYGNHVLVWRDAKTPPETGPLGLWTRKLGYKVNIANDALVDFPSTYSTNLRYVAIAHNAAGSTYDVAVVDAQDGAVRTLAPGMNKIAPACRPTGFFRANTLVVGGCETAGTNATNGRLVAFVNASLPGVVLADGLTPQTSVDTASIRFAPDGKRVFAVEPSTSPTPRRGHLFAIENPAASRVIDDDIRDAWITFDGLVYVTSAGALRRIVGAGAPTTIVPSGVLAIRNVSADATLAAVATKEGPLQDLAIADLRAPDAQLRTLHGDPTSGIAFFTPRRLFWTTDDVDGPGKIRARTIDTGVEGTLATDIHLYRVDFENDVALGYRKIGNLGPEPLYDLVAIEATGGTPYERKLVSGFTSIAWNGVYEAWSVPGSRAGLYVSLYR